MIFRRDVKYKIAKKLLDNVPKYHFLPCPYQSNLLESAHNQNTIICLSNELTKSFLVLSLLREMLYHNRSKKLLYFTQDNNIRDAAECLKRHNVGLSVAFYHYIQGPKARVPSEFAGALMRHEILVLSPWLIPILLLSKPGGLSFSEFLHNHVHLIVLSECHSILSAAHPYSDLMRLVDRKWEGLRIIGFTSALLPMSITDPFEAELRLNKLESLTHCRVETASELLTMLSLGARPKEHIYTIPPSARATSEAQPFHYFVSRLLFDTRLVLADASDLFLCPAAVTSARGQQTQSDSAVGVSVPDSRGRMIDVLDYCRRAVVQCEKILSELGVWCAGKIARVFVKHLVGLERRRARMLGSSGGLDRSGPLHDAPAQMPHDQVTRLLRFTATQFCIVARLFQVAFDTSTSLAEFRQMVSPKILILVDQIKTFKPSTQFKIEVARLPENPDLVALGKRARRKRAMCRSEQGSLTSLISSSDRSILLGNDIMGGRQPVRASSFAELPRGCNSPQSACSDNDTMSSVSDEDMDRTDSGETSSMRAVRHFSPFPSSLGSHSRQSSTRRFQKPIRGNAPRAGRGRNLHYFPASLLPRGGAEIDHNQYVYRAVAAKPGVGGAAAAKALAESVSNRICGLVMVACQFTAYALSCLIEELCVWDEDMFFLKPSHLFSHQSSSSTSSAAQPQANASVSTPGSLAARQTAVKTGDEAVAAPQGYTNLMHSSLSPAQEETINQFRRGAVNLLVATQTAVSAAAGGAELPRCNLVISLYPPASLAEYLASKARSRLVDDATRIVYLIDDDEGDRGADGQDRAGRRREKRTDPREILSRFRRLEDLLIRRCHGYSLFADEHEIDPVVVDTILPPFMPLGPDTGRKLTLSRAINVVNQYCARLPSDYFTCLTPRWQLRRVAAPDGFCLPASGPGASCGEGSVCYGAWLHRRSGARLYQCLLRLPINTPLKKCIKGELMACKKLAKLSAALNAIKALYELGELTTRWRPKTSAGPINPAYSVTSEQMLASGQSDLLLTPQRGSSGPGAVQRRRSSSRTSSLRWEARHDYEAEGSGSGFAEIDAAAAAEEAEQENDDDLTFNEEGGSLKQMASRRRQSYYRKYADQIRDCFPLPGDPSVNYLYYVDMRLTNPLPEEFMESSRHRTCSYRPEEEPLGFGILTRKALRCVPEFPIFSRSGEETIRLVELWCPPEEHALMVSLDPHQPVENCLPIPSRPLSKEQIDQLTKFHRIVFRGVLRLERELIMELDFEKAYMQLLLAPVRRDTLDIDWQFIELVLSSDTPEGVCRLLPRRRPVVPAVEEGPSAIAVTGESSQTPLTRQIRPGRSRASSFRARQAAAKLSLQDTQNQPGVFEFRAEDFINGVVMPAYRNIDQPQHYYVSEIRYDLNPQSAFPSTAYPTFAAYFSGKYDAKVSSLDQPLLDVDFTALRMNLLVPRHFLLSPPVGSTTGDKVLPGLRRLQDRRNVGDHEAHKQILLPELCLRHPFPASVWRKTVCLPSVLYRLECLLLAEELRQRIARETGMGRWRPTAMRLVPTSAVFSPTDAEAGDQYFGALRLVSPLFLPPSCRQLASLSPSASVTTDSSQLTGGAKPPTVPRMRRRAGRRSSRRGDKRVAAAREVQGDNLSEQTPSPASLSTDGGGVECGGGAVRHPDSDNNDEDDDYGVGGNSRRMNSSLGSTVAPEPQYVSLRAAPANAAPPPASAPPETSTPGRLGSCIVDLLDETKVIEFGCDVETVDPDQDAAVFMPVKNVKNVDREFTETGSDLESEDSFEGHVMFFPSDDDDDDDDFSGTENVDADADADVGNIGGCLTSCRSKSTKSYEPGPASLLQALTMSSANDFINLERMETIGDNFLKFVVTVHLFLSFPNAHEGKLSHLRNRVVCNANLYRLGRLKRLPELMVANKFGPCENWVPPGYYVRQDTRIHAAMARQARAQAASTVFWSTDPVMDDEVLLLVKPHDESRVKPIEDFPIGRWDPHEAEVLMAQTIEQRSATLQQVVPDKSVADCIEALIGCYLTTRGERSALRLMRWLGIDCFPQHADFLRPRGVPWIVETARDPVTSGDSRRVQLEAVRRAWGFDQLESQIGYTFNEPSLLIQAFTHPSYYELVPHNNNTDEITLGTDTDCYQRLEFLGDAVLDYVITRFLYNDSQQHSPGVLTDLRSALVNNNIFAALAVRFGFHRFLRASSPQLLHTLDAFVHYQKEVMLDDLDFITNEDVEVRQQSQSDLSMEEATRCLANNTNNLEPPDSQMPVLNPNSARARSNKDGVKKQGNAGDEDEDEDKEEDRVADSTISLLADQPEATQSKAAECRLTAGLVSPDAVALAKPTASVLTSSPVMAGQIHQLADDIEIPKALGDIFESLAGAIFLDSGLSLNRVWEVFYPLMRERIERYTACIPKSPVRQLLELEPEGTRFERPRRLADGRISVCAHVLGKGRFYGTGRNYRLAKSLAAKRALRLLRRPTASTERIAATAPALPTNSSSPMGNSCNPSLTATTMSGGT